MFKQNRTETALGNSHFSDSRSAVALAITCLVLACSLIGACASQASSSKDVKTESDRTDTERRARLRLELASGYFARGQISTALDEVKAALVSKPDMPEAYNLRGLIYANMSEEVLAEESFKKALQIAPRDADTLHNYGWYLCQRARYADAIGYFDQATTVPQYTGAGRSLMAKGICEARAGQLDAAERSLSRAFEYEPANPAIAVNLAEVLCRRGEYERARFYIRRVNAVPEQATASNLWLAMRIEKRLGNDNGARDLGEKLRRNYGQSNEAASYEAGRFDE